MRPPWMLLVLAGCDTEGTGATYPAADLVRFDIGAREPGSYDPRDGDERVQGATDAGHDWALTLGDGGVLAGVPALGEVREYALDGTDADEGTVVASGAAAEAFGAAVATLDHTVYVGVPEASAGPEAAGAGSVSRWTTKETRLDGATAQGHLGATLAACGDLAGDGVPDLLAGAPWEGDLGGRVYLLADGLTSAELGTLTAVTGEPNGGFGQALACGRDLLGDTAPDIVVGAPFSSGATGEAGAGQVTVWTAATWGSGAPSATLFGQATAEPASFGAAVATCHLRADSRGDLVVGAPGAAGGAGAAYLFIGRDELVDRASPTLTLRGSTTGDRFGGTVACADVDGDGLDEVIVGAPGQDAPDGTREAGAVYVFAGIGGSTGTLGASGAAWTLTADRAFLRTGRTFLAGDLDDDGRAELILLLRQPIRTVEAEP